MSRGKARRPLRSLLKMPYRIQEKTLIESVFIRSYSMGFVFDFFIRVYPVLIHLPLHGKWIKFSNRIHNFYPKV